MSNHDHFCPGLGHVVWFLTVSLPHLVTDVLFEKAKGKKQNWTVIQKTEQKFSHVNRDISIMTLARLRWSDKGVYQQLQWSQYCLNWARTEVLQLVSTACLMRALTYTTHTSLHERASSDTSSQSNDVMIWRPNKQWEEWFEICAAHARDRPETCRYM